jgi:hemin uptake protein HemP
VKGMGKLKPTGLALLAAATLLATAACTPTSPDNGSSPGPSASNQSPTPTGTATATASAPASPVPSASPSPSATVGALVEGFPSKLLPLMPGAKVVSSSFDKTGSPATAAIVGSVGAPAADVLAFYTKELEAQGFKAVPGESVETVTSKDFLRGENETINVAVVHNGGVSTFTIGANVSPESAK